MYATIWLHTCGEVIFSLNRSRTVGLMSRLSLTERHWNCILPDPSFDMVALEADTFW